MADYRLIIANGFDNRMVFNISGGEMAEMAIQKARDLINLLGGRAMLVNDYNRIIIHLQSDLGEEE